jgi:CheY-like chemotaxis protein
MKHVLIIDDDKTFIETMKACIDTKKYSFASAADGIDGLDAVTKQKPDVILLDIQMPRMNGIDFLKALNTKYGEGKIPILVTSNSSSMDTISEGVSLGIRGYVVKANESLQGICNSIDTILK